MEYKIIEKVSDSGRKVYIFEENTMQVALNSLYSPEKEAIRFLKKLCDIEKHVIIFVGFGNGTLMEKLVEQEVFEQNIHCLFVEPIFDMQIDEQHLAFINNNPKLTYINFKNFNATTFAKFISEFASIPVSIQIHPNYLKINQKIIKNSLEIIDEGIKTRQILNNTELKFAVDWLIEPLLNSQHISNSYNLKNNKGRFKGERAMLIASGPTLKEHISFIKEKRDSFHLFAVGSALRALLENDINPDYVLSIDASDRNYHTHFEGLNFKGTLIYETMSNANIQANHQGPLIVSRALSDYVIPLFTDELTAFTQTSPSVAVYSLQVIAYLGFSEVYLVGQDLALVNGDYYADGIQHHEGMKGLEEELVVLSNSGKMVGTTRALKIFLDSFEGLIKRLPEGLNIYNLSLHGAKIEGTKYTTPEKVSEGEKRKIHIDDKKIQMALPSNVGIKKFLDDLFLLKDEIYQSNKALKRYIQIGVVSPNDMKKVVKQFRGVAKHNILEDIILSQLTFMFDAIINKFVYFEEKQKYSSEELLHLVKELSNFYQLVLNFVGEILADKRLQIYQ